jgi:hypothetical protein
VTRDDWRRAEPLLTRALPLRTEEQKRVIETAFLDEAIRSELLDVLRQTNRVLPRTVQSGAAAGAAQGSAWPPGEGVLATAPVLAANDTLADERFRIIRQLGRGGMADVYLAFDSTLETLVALKVLRLPQTREAQHARLCSGHPHIATMHDVIETSVAGRMVTVLVMEHVAGRPLSRILEDGPVTIADAVLWTRQVAAALAHAHDCNVVHCDLKPANILITPDGAKVVDFGIGRATFENPDDGPLGGTLPYMAPEQLTEGRFSRSSDIYALGVTLFELVTGRVPFEGHGPEVMLRIIGAPPPPLGEFRRGVPAELEEIVSRALAKSPAERYRSARAFEHALERFDVQRAEHGPSRDLPDVSRRVAYGVTALAAVLALVTFTGYVTSMLFNSPLQRTPGFSGESAWDWPFWGVRALVAAGIVTALAAGALAGVKGLCNVIASLPRVRSVCRPLQRLLHEQVSQVAPTPLARARLLLIAQAVFLVGFAWYFRDIFEGLDSFISQRPPVDLSPLGPGNQPRHIWFDLILCLHVWVFGVAWFRMLRREASSGTRRNARIAAGGLAVTAAALLVGQVVPFRIIYHNESERVLYRSQLCYIVGQRGSEALLFCPLQPPPWSRVVKLEDAALQRDGTIENIFSGVQPPIRAERFR